MAIPSCQIGPGPQAEVLMLDVRRVIGRPRQRRLFSAAGLNTGLFICADDVIIGTQWSALPDALIKIEEGSGFAGKVALCGWCLETIKFAMFYRVFQGPHRSAAWITTKEQT